MLYSACVKLETTAYAEVLHYALDFFLTSYLPQQGCQSKVRKIFNVCQDRCGRTICFIFTHIRQKLIEPLSMISYLASNKVLNQTSRPKMICNLYARIGFP